MSARDCGLGLSAVGLRTPYRNACELVQDKDQLILLAEALDVSPRNVRKDPFGEWLIQGKGSRLESWGDLSSYLLYLSAKSARKWGAIKRKAKAFGLEITQDGDAEGCFRLGLPNEAQAAYLRALLGLRRRRHQRSNETTAN